MAVFPPTANTSAAGGGWTPNGVNAGLASEGRIIRLHVPLQAMRFSKAMRPLSKRACGAGRGRTPGSRTAINVIGSTHVHNCERRCGYQLPEEIQWSAAADYSLRAALRPSE